MTKQERDDTIDAIMAGLPGSCLVDAELLEEASDAFVEMTGNRINATLRNRPGGKISVTEDTRYGALKFVGQDAGGMMLLLSINDRLQYAGGWIRISGTRLPDTVIAAAAGRRLVDLVELPVNVIHALTKATIEDAARDEFASGITRVKLRFDDISQ